MDVGQLGSIGDLVQKHAEKEQEKGLDTAIAQQRQEMVKIVQEAIWEPPIRLK